MLPANLCSSSEHMKQIYKHLCLGLWDFRVPSPSSFAVSSPKTLVWQGDNSKAVGKLYVFQKGKITVVKSHEHFSWPHAPLTQGRDGSCLGLVVPSHNHSKGKANHFVQACESNNAEMPSRTCKILRELQCGAQSSSTNSIWILNTEMWLAVIPDVRPGTWEHKHQLGHPILYSMPY